MKKILISLFAVLNILTVLYANEPDAVSRWEERAFGDRSSYSAYRVHYAEWMIRTYGFYVGLDNYWTLFSYLPRFNHWYVIKAKYADGTERLLPLPLQGERTFLQRYFFDFRAAKYYLNIYNKRELLDRYGRYLCREFHEYNSSPAVSVTIEMHYRYILARKVALERSTTADSGTYQQTFSQVSCVGRD